MAPSNHLLPVQSALPRTLWPETRGQDADADAVPEASEPQAPPEVRLPWAQAERLASAGGPAVPELGAQLHGPLGQILAQPPVVPADHLSLAVALDVLATHVAPITPTANVLSAVTDALLAVRQTRPDDQGLVGDDALAAGWAMRHIALGPVGEARAALAQDLAGCTQALGHAADALEGVVQACGQLVRGAKEVTALAILAMEARAQREQQGGR